jgi:hypothetical protein
MYRHVTLSLILFTVVVFFDVQARATPHEVLAFLNDPTNNVNDEGLLPEKPPQVLDFARYIVNNWHQVESDFLILAPDPRRQALIVVAAEFLRPHEYVQFVDGICSKAETGRVSVSTILAITRASMSKSGFWAFNFDNAEVSKVVGELEAILQRRDPGTWTQFFQAIESGRAKQAIVLERQHDGEALPESFGAERSGAY